MGRYHIHYRITGSTWFGNGLGGAASDPTIAWIRSCIYYRRRRWLEPRRCRSQIQAERRVPWSRDSYPSPCPASQTATPCRRIPELKRITIIASFVFSRRNFVTRNYCCHAREVTLSLMDTLLALLLTYLLSLTYLLTLTHSHSLTHSLTYLLSAILEKNN